jgi:hypothetical protein
MIIIYKKYLDTPYHVICFFDIEIELEKIPLNVGILREGNMII